MLVIVVLVVVVIVVVVAVALVRLRLYKLYEYDDDYYYGSVTYVTVWLSHSPLHLVEAGVSRDF